jgi:prophage maintenance system killer protein
MNGYTFNCTDETLYNEIIEMAKSEIKKEDLIKFYEKHSNEQ